MNQFVFVNTEGPVQGTGSRHIAEKFDGYGPTCVRRVHAIPARSPFPRIRSQNPIITHHVAAAAPSRDSKPGLMYRRQQEAWWHRVTKRRFRSQHLFFRG